MGTNGSPQPPNRLTSLLSPLPLGPSSSGLPLPVRDSSVSLTSRVARLATLLTRIEPIPPDWIEGRSLKAKPGGTDLELLPCTSWKELETTWRKPLRWTDGLSRALSFMLSIVASTREIDDQLWGKVIGPASCGKSTLCEALSVNRDVVVAKSTVRGFHSGYKSDKEGTEDHSLVARLRGKVLVTKDGDTLLQSPELPRILAEARDLYDSTARTHYRHGLSRDYQGIRMTWILCGTSSLRLLDSSELGERFLDCVIMEGIDDELENEILYRVAHRVHRNLGRGGEGGLGPDGGSSRYDPNLTKAMQLTGGYVDYLYKNANRLLARIHLGDEALSRCMRLGKFVAHMRARPSRKQEEGDEREFATRLVSQLVRLTKCTAVVLNETTATPEVLRRTARVALDTARGRTLNILKHLVESADGSELAAVADAVNQTEDKCRTLLRFLRSLDVVDLVQKVYPGGIKSRPRWVVTSKMRSLYQDARQYAADLSEGLSPLPLGDRE